MTISSALRQFCDSVNGGGRIRINLDLYSTPRLNMYLNKKGILSYESYVPKALRLPQPSHSIHIRP